MKENFREMITNKALTDTCFAFNPLLPEEIAGENGSEGILTGAVVQENGDIIFRIYAPKAKEVSVDIKILTDMPPIPLVKRENGIFEGTFPYRPDFTGPKTIDYIIDGTVMLHPYTPICFCYNRPVNYVEIPDSTAEHYLMKNVPHGAVTRHVYFSEAIGEWESCLVYTPPGYEEGETFPVLYLQHGHTENEITWIYNGKMAYILDNLISENKCVPFIVVLNDGMVRKQGDDIGDFSSFENMLLNDCIPFIEKIYHVKTDKWNRALAGLSMGSMQTSYIGIRHPELFGYLGLFSGFMGIPMWDTPAEQSEHLRMLRENPKEFEKNFRIFFRSWGDKDNCMPFFEKDEEFCLKYGIHKLQNYHKKIYPFRYHDWGAWRDAIYDFAQLIFREKEEFQI